MKRYYECTFIVNPGLDDPQIDGVVKSVEDVVEKNGGEIREREIIGRRRLAYPIAKKHNGYYASIEFDAEPHTVDKVERQMKLNENIMRYLTLQLEPKELEAKRQRIAQAKELERARAAEAEANANAEEKKAQQEDENKEKETAAS